MYILPKEVEIWHIIPAIRKEFAKCLINNYKITYEKAGKILGVSKAIISQYLKEKRSIKVKLDGRILKEIEKSCKRLINRKSNASREIILIFRFVKNKNLFCKIYDGIKKRGIDNCKEIRLETLYKREK